MKTREKPTKCTENHPKALKIGKNALKTFKRKHKLSKVREKYQ